MRFYPLLLCALLAACSSQTPSEQANKTDSAAAQTSSQGGAKPAPEKIVPKGEFADIDVAKSQQAMEAIQQGKGETVNTIMQAPNDYTPEVLYLVSAIMFQNKYQDEAVFWFYTAELRARSDANKSGDKTAHSVVNQLNQFFGANIVPYSLSNPERLKAVIDQVLKSDAEQKRNYDPRWIALLSKDVLTETQIKFYPKEKWPEIDALTRNQFRQAIDQALANTAQPAAK